MGTRNELERACVDADFSITATPTEPCWMVHTFKLEDSAYYCVLLDKYDCCMFGAKYVENQGCCLFLNHHGSC